MSQQVSAKEPNAEQIAEQKIYKQMGVSDSEYELICGFLGRKPNYTEIGVFSVMWSEHCAYKNSKPLLRRFPTSGPRVLMGPGEGAGIVDIGDNQAVVFKSKAITTLPQWSLTKALRRASAGLSAIFFRWGPDRLRCLTLCVSASWKASA